MYSLRITSLAALLLFAVGPLRAQNSSPILGEWEGQSLCVVRDSPCHDEHVIYRFKSSDGKLTVDAFKLVNGERQFMGTLDCDFNPAQKTLACTSHSARQDNWQFHLSNNELTGTLVLGPEKTLYRKVHVTRRSPSSP